MTTLGGDACRWLAVVPRCKRVMCSPIHFVHVTHIHTEKCEHPCQHQRVKSSCMGQTDVQSSPNSSAKIEAACHRRNRKHDRCAFKRRSRATAFLYCVSRRAQATCTHLALLSKQGFSNLASKIPPNFRPEIADVALTEPVTQRRRCLHHSKTYAPHLYCDCE